MSLSRTHWGYITLLLIIGIVTAMQVGKVPPAVSALQADLGLDLVAAAWVLSLFSAVGAVIGGVAGSVANRFGPQRTTFVALLIMAVASALGARSGSTAALLLSRAVEGTAFVAAVVAIPSLLAESASQKDRRFAAALWGIYMPTGTAIVLTFAPPILLAAGWRALWNWNAWVLLALALLLLTVRLPVAKGESEPFRIGAFVRTLLHHDAWTLALAYTGYTYQYLAVLGFLPTIFEEQGASAQRAGALTAFAVLANAAGNLVASALIARHITPRALIVSGLVMMAVAAIGLYSPWVSASMAYWMCVAFFFFGGLVPASVFATVATVARDTGSGAMTMGLIVQASHIGQMIGPPVVAAVAAATGGWEWSPLALLPATAASLLAIRSVRAAAVAR